MLRGSILPSSIPRSRRLPGSPARRLRLRPWKTKVEHDGVERASL
jgi:hypothetical protein